MPFEEKLKSQKENQRTEDIFGTKDENEMNKDLILQEINELKKYKQILIKDVDNLTKTKQMLLKEVDDSIKIKQMLLKEIDDFKKIRQVLNELEEFKKQFLLKIQKE